MLPIALILQKFYMVSGQDILSINNYLLPQWHLEPVGFFVLHLTYNLAKLKVL